MPLLPTGTVTFLFTDIEGSTRLLHELGADGYAAALDEHRRVLRAAFAANGGVECDTQGDAFFFAFPTVQGAIEAVVRAQRDLATGPVRVRMGLHTGTPLVTPEGYVGVDVHRAARIAAAGHGCQVLLSQSTAALTDGRGLTDLGLHYFKDLAAAERVFQLGDGMFPPLKSLYRTNLPVAPTPFLGREAELAETAELLIRRDLRLVTLTGPGGTGKTRLAVQAAANVWDHFPDGIFWVPLAALRDATIVPSAVLQAIGSKEQTAKTPLQSLVAGLAGKRLLLVLDNAEHLMPAVANVIADLISGAPTIRVLVTSRERLRLQGEHTYPVPPMTRADGVRLFLERAHAVDPSVLYSTSVDTLCERLDRSPLALELAAARTGLYTPEQLVARLGKRLDLLKGDRDRDPRQQTLRATIAWSYDLLTRPEQSAFTRLSVFAGGATLEAVEAVCEIDADVMQSLLDKSLLRRRADDGPRFSMLEMIREYALERLNESDGRDETVRRYENWYVEFADLNDSRLRGPDGSNISRRLRLEHDNFRAILVGALGRGDGETLLRLAAALWSFWLHHGHLDEGRSWLDKALSVSDRQPTRIRAHAYNGASAIALHQRDLRHAHGYADSSLRIAHELGDDRLIAIARMTLGLVSSSSGDFPDAAEQLAEARSIFAALGDDVRSAQVLRNWGHTELKRGRFDRAVELLAESLALSRKIGNDRQLAFTLSTFGMTRLGQGDAEAARTLIEEALDRAVLAEEEGLTLDCIEALASVLAVRQQWESAARLFGFAEAFRSATGIPDPDYRFGVTAAYGASTRSAMRQEMVAYAWTSGSAMTLSDAVALARSLNPAAFAAHP